MKKVIHMTLMIAGTSIGAGLIALPMSVVNLGSGLVFCLTFGMCFITYQSLWMAADLNILDNTPVSIVELSRKYGGRIPFAITLACFYLLFFGLLTVYFSCISDTLSTFCSLDAKVAIGICGCGLLLLLSLPSKIFSTINSFFVVILVSVIFIAIVHISHAHSQVKIETRFQINDLLKFLPILFTSFGVQGTCPYICMYFENNRKKIGCSFALGLLLPAAIYFFWSFCVLKNTIAYDPAFFHRMQAHQVSVGELIQFLCDSSAYPLMGIFLKLLTLFAILTSTIGVSMGILQSLQSFLPKWVAKILLCVIPVIVNLTIADAFLKVLSFAGMMLVIMGILIPYYLLKKTKQKRTFSYKLCWLSGIIILLCELHSFF